MSNEPVSYKLEGLEELLTFMKAAPEVVEKRVVKSGVRLAGSRLRTFMRRAAPKGDKGLLRKSITMKYIGEAKVKVGLNSRQYYKTLDQGRKAYKRKKTGVEVKASPTMNTQGTMIEQTWSAKKREIAQIMVQGMRLEMYKQLGRLAIRGGYQRRR